MSKRESALPEFVRRGWRRLHGEDPELYALLDREVTRQGEVLTMIAASSVADPSVLVCEGTPISNVTAEGYPGARFHAGCDVADAIERLAAERARRAFGARYANVQPHSGTSANEAVLFHLLRPGDAILGMDLDSGGHLSHGARASVVGAYFQAFSYGLDGNGRIDFGQVEELAQRQRPKVIVCGASAYPRTIDFERFRRIADDVGAFVLADVSHIAGLIVAGMHPSPIDHAHFTTTSTYKQLFGPRGGVILMGRAADAPGPDGARTLAETLQAAVFPHFQGTPNLSAIAAKARAFAAVLTPGFRKLAERIVETGRALAERLAERSFDVVSGGSDTHLVLVDLRRTALSGYVAEAALERCGVIANRNRVRGDARPAAVASGIRFGTNTLASRGMSARDMADCAALIADVLGAVRPLDERRFELSDGALREARGRVRSLCERFPLPGYGRTTGSEQ